MFYDNKLLLKKSGIYKLSLSTFRNGINTETDENSLPYKYAKLTYNFSFKKGSLQTGLGFDVLKLPEYYDQDVERIIKFPITPDQIKKIWLYPFYYNEYSKKTYIMLVSCDNVVHYGQLVSINPYLSNISPSKTFTSDPNAVYYNIDGEDVMLITSATDGMYVFHPNIPSEFNTTAPKVISMCRHYERIFAIEEGKRNKLVFSSNLDPTNWDMEVDAGYIEIVDEQGALQRVLSFNDYVYIFKEYGIARLSAYGDQAEFSLSNLYVSSGKIYGNSVCACGDRIMFLARDGIYAFNGSSTVKLSLNIESLLQDIDNENCCSAYHKGKYYLGCKLDYNDGEEIGCERYAGGYINNTLIELDLKTGEINLTRGVDLKHLCSIEYGFLNKLVAAFNNEHKSKLGQLTNDGKIFGTVLKKVWTSPNTNLGYANKPKKIKSFSLISKNDCKIIVKTDRDSKEFNIKGKKSTSIVYPNITGEMFQFSIESDIADANISVPEITIGVSQ
jgi:hypothetical protein